MRQLPQQYLDNMSASELLHYTSNEMLIPKIEQEIHEEIEYARIKFEAEFWNEMVTEVNNQYDAGWDQGFNEGLTKGTNRSKT